jgi:hypothetical protein
MRKRMLVAVAVASLLTIAATGCRGASDDVIEHGDDAVRHGDDAVRHGDDAGGSEPGSVQIPQADPRDAVDAACRARNSSEVNNSDTDEADGNTYADGVCS